MRRMLLGILILGALMAPVGVDAQQSSRGARVGILVPGTPATWMATSRYSVYGYVSSGGLKVRISPSTFGTPTTSMIGSRPWQLSGRLATLDHGHRYSDGNPAAARATAKISIVFETLGDALSLGVVSGGAS